MGSTHPASAGRANVLATAWAASCRGAVMASSRRLVTTQEASSPTPISHDSHKRRPPRTPSRYEQQTKVQHSDARGADCSTSAAETRGEQFIPTATDDHGEADRAEERRA